MTAGVLPAAGSVTAGEAAVAAPWSLTGGDVVSVDAAVPTEYNM